MKSELSLSMKIAIFGATSQIAKDLVLSFSKKNNHDLVLFARRPVAVTEWMGLVGLSDRYLVANFESFTADKNFDAIINFVGVGNPAQAALIGASIFDVTIQYDELALNYLHEHPDCRYIFLSSGAAYCSSFEEPADSKAKTKIDINNLQPQDWYGVAKLHAECRHRSLSHLSIVDVRVFNYFSHTQDMNASFLITDIVRAICDKTTLKVSGDFIVRDYIGSSDFYQLIQAIIDFSAVNGAVDCYSKAPVDKKTLLTAMKLKYGLKYEFVESKAVPNSTGIKPNYFSNNKQASKFGYIPKLSSLEYLLLETGKMIKKNKKNWSNESFN